MLTKSTLLMGMLVAMGSGSASANDDQEITKGYTIKVTHSHTGDAPIIVENQPVLKAAQYSASQKTVTLTFDKAVAVADLQHITLKKNGATLSGVTYMIDADQTRVMATLNGVATADELSVQFKNTGVVAMPVAHVATAKFVPKLEVTRQLNKKVMGKVERGAKISAVLTNAQGQKITQPVSVNRSGLWSSEVDVAPGSYTLTVVAEKNQQKIVKEVAMHIVK